LNLRQRYAGPTDRRAGIDAAGRCTGHDKRNVVSFGPLPEEMLAVACVWRTDGTIVEADIVISDTAGLFFLVRPDRCVAQWDLEGTLTHEFGHVFGLGHVPNAAHGALTMSDGLPGCSTDARSLGLGDYLALRARYRRW